MTRPSLEYRVIRPFVFCVLVGFVSVLAGVAQTPSFDEGRLMGLKGNVLPTLAGQPDLGLAPETMVAERLMLILKRSPEQEAGLQAFLKAVQDPNSREFRKFMTPEEFGRRYGVSDAELGRIRQWLGSHGLHVAGVNKGRTAMEFSGTVGQLQETFRTTIHRYQMGDSEHWANASDPQIPSALARVVGGVASLNDLKPRANVIKGPPGKWDAKQHRFVPDLTIKIKGTDYLFVGPGDAATIYDSPNSMNVKLKAGQAQYDGTGVTIGVVGTSLLNDSGPDFYRSLFNLPNADHHNVFDGNTYNLETSNETEAILDLEVSGGLAPGAASIYYAAADTLFQSGLFLAIYRAIDDNQVDILSVSYGACEAALGASGNLQVLNAWEQAAAQGIAVTVSTGDSGSAGCDNPNTESIATHGLGVNGLASTPYNIAVGGTDFDVLAGNFATYVSGTNSTNFTSALGYIPEAPWNNSTATNGSLAANTVSRSSAGATNIVGGGGGASSAGTGTAGYAKPGWQQGFAPSNTDAVRDLPDVSLLAANGKYGAIWALCEGSDCDAGTSSTIHGVGGTSASAPAFAGVLAMVQQKMGAAKRLGQANWVLYKLAQTHPSVFHGITSGNISVYCSPGSANCGSNSFLTGYNSGPGYNPATGLGSVDVSALVNAWGSDVLTGTTTTVALDKTAFVHGTTVTVSAGVTPAGASGDVAIETNYAAQAGAFTSVEPFRLALSGGSASGSYSQLPGGTYNVYASYAGDGTHGGSTSQPVAVTISREDSVVNFSVDALSSNQATSVAGKTVPLGTFVALNAQPIGLSQAGSKSPIANATGSVVFTDSNAGGDTAGLGNGFLDSTGNASAIVNYMPAGTHTITADYGGDLSYNPSSGTPVTFTIAKAATTITVSTADSSVFSGSFNVTANISANLPVNGLFNMGGPITFTDSTSNTVLGTATTSFNCSGAITHLCLIALISVDVSQLAPGDNSIVASYTGDANFLGSGPSPATVVNCVAGCSNPAGEAFHLSFGQVTGGTIAPGGTTTAEVSVYETGGFTGAVNLSCTVVGTKSSDQHIPTCAFNAGQVNLTSGNAVTSTLTVKTTAPVTTSARAGAEKTGPGGIPVGAGTALAGVLLFGIARRRVKSLSLLGLLILIVGIGGMTACGGGGSGGGGGGGPTTIPGTTADVYTVTFRAVDAATGTVTAQDYMTFTVN